MKSGLIFSLFILIVFPATLEAQQSWTLQQCIDYALQHNIGVRQNLAQQQRSEIATLQSKLALLPEVNAGASHGYNWGQRVDPYTNEFASARVQSNNFYLNGSLTLFNGLQKFYNIKQSEALLKAEQQNTEAAKLDIATQVSTAFLNVLINREILAVNQAQLELTQEQTSRMELLVNAGALNQSELYEIRAQQAQEQYNITTAANAVKLAMLQLQQLMNLPPEQSQNFDINGPEIADMPAEAVLQSPADIYAVATKAMPVVKAAEARREAANLSLSLSRGAYYPSLILSGTLATGYSGANQQPADEGINFGPQPIGTVVVNGNSQTVYSFVDYVEYSTFEPVGFRKQLEDNFNQNLQVQLNIPIFNGNTARANVQRSKIDVLESELAYADIKNQLYFEIEQAHADALAALDSYYAAKKAAESLELAFSFAEVRYEQQLINTVDFNDVKTRYNAAQSQMIQARYDYIFKLLLLDFFQGKPLKDLSSKL